MRYLNKLVLFTAPLVLVFIFIGFAVPRARAADSAPIEKAKAMAVDDTRSTIFVLNNDKTISAYDLAKKEFVISRLLLPGLALQNPSLILVSPGGAFLAIISTSNRYRQILVFRVTDIIEHQPLNPTAVYTFPHKVSGTQVAAFSPDGQTLFLAYGNTLSFLSTEKSKKVELTIGGGDLTRIAPIGLKQVAVVNKNKDAVLVVNVARQNVTYTIPVGLVPQEILYNEFTKKLYISHTGSDDVYVIDPQSGKVVATVSVEADPTSLAYRKENGDVFVANNGPGTISIIGADNKTKTIDLKSPAYFNGSPLLLSFLNKDNKLLIVNVSAGDFFLFDAARSVILKSGETLMFTSDLLASETLGKFFLYPINADSFFEIDAAGTVTRIPEHSFAEEPYFSVPQTIYMISDLDKIFVMNIGNNIMTVIDASTLKPIAKIPVNRSPQGAVFMGATKKLYVSSPSDSTIAVVDTTKPDYPVRIITGVNQPLGINANQKTNRIYVATNGGPNVTVINGETDAVIGSIEFPKGSVPVVVNINEYLNKVYVVLYGKNTLAVIDGNTNTLETEIAVGQNPIWNRYIPSLQRIFVTTESDRTVVVIDPRTNRITQTFRFSGSPYRLFYDERTQYMYVTLRKENKVVIIRQKKDSADLEVFKEVDIAFWGQTDKRPYNYVAVDRERRLAYFTSGAANEVVVVKDDLDGEGIKKPVFYARILANGDVVLSPEAKEKLAPKGYLLSLPSGIYYYLIGAGFLIMTLILYRIARKKSAMPPVAQ